MVLHRVMATILVLWSLPTNAAPLSDINNELFASLSNHTALHQEIAPSWMPTAGVRGTSDVLWSCVVTLTLCVYTAIHLNIPPPEEGHFAFYVRKTKWVLVAIVAPEIVVYTAFHQWSQARKVTRELNSLKLHDEGPKPNQVGRYRSSYDMTYGFYAVMGGFVVNVSQLHNDLSRVTLSAPGIIALAQYGHFLDISNESIKDKSKADVLAKTLVITQVSWLIVNCIGRNVSGFPLSLLEIHTLVHVVCALVMYTLWFKKPLDIRDPTLVSMLDIKEPIAMLLMVSPCAKPWKKFRTLKSLAEADSLQLYKSTSGDPHEDPTSVPDVINYKIGVGDAAVESKPKLREGERLNTFQSLDFEERQKESWRLDEKYQAVVSLRSGQHLPNRIGPGFEYFDRIERANLRKKTHRVRLQRKLYLSEKDINRWRYVATFIRRETIEIPQDTSMTSSLHEIFESLGIRKNTNYISLGVPNLAPTSSRSISGALGSMKAAFKEEPHRAFEGFMLSLLPVIYGAVHLLAWRFQFATKKEEILWKASCFDLILSSISFWLGQLFWSVAQLSDQDSWTYIWLTLASWSSFMPLVLNIPFYVAARLYLVVESFASLRHVPLGVYATVPWSNYIPHI